MPEKLLHPKPTPKPARKSQVRELAEHLGVSRQNVNRLLLAGRIPGAFQASDGRWILGLSVAVQRGTRGPRASYRGPRSVPTTSTQPRGDLHA